MTQRSVLLLCALMLSFGHANVRAQSYPTKVIRYIVPFPPGGGNDILAREISQHLAKNLGQQVVVDNRPGASAMIGTALAAKSPPDGYTLFMGSNSALTINPSLFEKLPYDPVKDFAPITLLTSQPYVLLVNPAVPARNVTELIMLARSRPGQLNFGSAGTGVATHLAGEMLKSMAKIDIVHVPYKGAGPAIIDTIGGQVEMTFNNVISALPHIRSGKLRVLAVTSRRRSAVLPEVPTMAETGDDLAAYDASGWYGMLAPRRTPRPVIDKLNFEVARILSDPAVRKKLMSDGADVIGGTPEDFSRAIQEGIEKWARVIKLARIKVDPVM